MAESRAPRPAAQRRAVHPVDVSGIHGARAPRPTTAPPSEAEVEEFNRQLAELLAAVAEREARGRTIRANRKGGEAA